jgi:mannose-6-phosphate isomerase-like protein (cupin superfamily)
VKFSVSHLSDAHFEPRGLRSFFEYRDLGIREATDGKVLAHVIRAKPGASGVTGAHFHKLDFQMFYVIRGWIEFDYQGVGRVRAEAGSCVHQPPGIEHDEIAHSDDLELIEITLPAEFETVEVGSLRS